MIIQPPKKNRAMLTTELVVALGILIATLLPIAFSIVKDRRLLRAYEQRAVLMELVDGEMEALVAGEWTAYAEGTNYLNAPPSMKEGLPSGKFLILRDGKRIRVEWLPENARLNSAYSREVVLP
jgi:hypothetical protein